MTWDELVASIVKNTSMTVKDIGEMSYPELENLMEGMATNAKKEEAYLKGEEEITTQGDSSDFMNFMMNGGM